MNHTIAMMQPYLFPYLGYFQLIAAADVFVLGDDLQYVKDGWINRNRILNNGEPGLITFPLKKGHHDFNINERYLSDNFQDEITRLLKTIGMTYSRAPRRDDVLPLLEKIMRYPQKNLALYSENSIREIGAYLKIITPIVISSELKLPPPTDHQDRVILTMKALGGATYINPIGGRGLYCSKYFSQKNLKLKFHRMHAITYPQLKAPFVPNLSIIDVMMFNSVEDIDQQLKKFSLEACPPPHVKEANFLGEP
jgi:hypothetical protein